MEIGLDIERMGVLGYSCGFTLWVVPTGDRLPDVFGEGYFDRAAPFLRPGDLMIVVSSRPDRPGQASSAIVSVVGVGEAERSVRVCPLGLPPREFLAPTIH